jgi:hypothetical protein
MVIGHVECTDGSSRYHRTRHPLTTWELIIRGIQSTLSLRVQPRHAHDLRGLGVSPRKQTTSCGNTWIEMIGDVAQHGTPERRIQMGSTTKLEDLVEHHLPHRMEGNLSEGTQPGFILEILYSTSHHLHPGRCLITPRRTRSFKQHLPCIQ